MLGLKTARPNSWLLGDRELGGWGCPAIMGILNVTPDSFFDGGAHNHLEQAIAHTALLHSEGANVIDIGGESSRPGAPEVDVHEELRRVLPPVTKAVENGFLVTVDTTKAKVAEECLKVGAHGINDISALQLDPRMIDVVAEHRCSVVLNHMQGTPRSMQNKPQYEDVVSEVRDFLLRQADRLMARGIPPMKICLDPGIGFGKNDNHNYRLVGFCAELVKAGFPVLMGTSRKSFIGRTLGLEKSDRLYPSLASNVIARTLGCSVFRVHDVGAMRECFILQAELERQCLS